MNSTTLCKLDELAVEQGCYFDEAPARKVRKFLETYCVQSKHPWTGKPLKLLDWQWHDIIKPLYGWFNKDGTRRYNKAIIYIPKKQGKTTLLSGLALYHLLEYEGSEVYCIASDIQQAGVLYSQSADMVELCGPLDKRLWVRRNINSIEDKKRKSKFKVLSSTPEGKSGFSANFLALDEISEWNATHARTIYDRLVNAGMARTNSLQMVISTAQYDRSHLGYELFKTAKDILAGEIKDIHTLPVVYSLDDEDDWTKESNWWKVNPSVDITVPRQFYRDEYSKIESSPSAEARFRTFLLCQWVGHSQQFIASNIWSDCQEDFTEQDLYDCEAFIGTDMARRLDLAAYVVVVPKDDKLYLLPRFFMPRENALKKEQADRVPYTRWEREGHITLTDGDVIDPTAIRESIIKDCELFDVLEVRFDPYGFEDSRQILEYEHGLPMVEVKQSYTSMSSPTAHFERKVLDNSIRHNGNPILSWNLGNTTIRSDNNDRILIDKMRSNGRIDGITAAIIGLSGVQAMETTGDTDLVVLL